MLRTTTSIVGRVHKDIEDAARSGGAAQETSVPAMALSPSTPTTGSTSSAETLFAGVMAPITYDGDTGIVGLDPSLGVLTDDWDLPVYTGTALARLGKGAEGYGLGVAAGDLSWLDFVINPMTASGDLIYGGAAGWPTRLAMGASTSDILMGGGGGGSGGGGLAGYTKRVPVTVDGSVPGISSPVDGIYWLAVPAALKAVCLSGGADFRATLSDNTLLDYAIVDWGASEPIVAIRDSAIPTGTKTIYLYGGNSGASSAASKPDVASGLTLLLPMADASSPADDWSSNAYDGSQSGGVTFGAAGKIDKSCTFAGDDDYLDCTAAALAGWAKTDAFSLAAWVKTSVAGGGGGGSGLSGWLYRVPVTVDGSVPGISSPVDGIYWLAVPAALKAVCLSGGADFRATLSDNTLLDYAIVDWGASEPIVAIRDTAIPTGTKTIYLYGGNSGASSAASKPDVASGLTLLIPGSDAASPADDWTANAYDGTQSGGVTFGQAGKVANSLLFDGTDDCLDCTAAAATGWTKDDAFSFSAWFKTSENSATIVIMSKYMIVGQVRGYFLALTSGHVYFQLQTDASDCQYKLGSANVADGNWHHVAAFNDPGSTYGLYIYVDGVQDAVGPPDSGGTLGDITNTNDFEIGRRNHTMQCFWDGNLQQLMATAGAFSVDQIKVLAKSYPGSSMFSAGTVEYLGVGASPAGQIIASKYAGTTPAGYLLGVTGGNLYFELQSGSATYVYQLGSTNVADDAWHHVAATYDGSGGSSGITLYVDGAAESMSSGTAGTLGTITNSNAFEVGRCNHTSPCYFTGSIQQVIATDGELSADVVKVMAKSYPGTTMCSMGTMEDPGGGGAPHWSSDLAADVTIDTHYIYRAGGTDVAIADGGTGAGTKAAGFDALSPMAAAGDLIYGGTAGAGTALNIGSAGKVLRSTGTAPAWVTLGAGDVAATGPILLGRLTGSLGACAELSDIPTGITIGGHTIYRDGGTDVAVADGGTGASDASTARTNLGLGSMATQSAAAVSISGGSITGLTSLGVGNLDAGTTKTSPDAVSAWLPIGGGYYVPAYTSKTS